MRSSLAPFLALAFTVQSPPEPDVAARVREWLRPAAEAGHLSGALLVARDDEILVEAAFGMANAEHRVLNRVDTRFAVASITKEMTFAATIRLAETGKLKLDDTLAKWLPEFPRGDALHVIDLLRHRAGIPHRVTTPEDECVPRSAQDMVELAAKAPPLDIAPGSRSVYSSAGYSVLARVLELASGKSYGELMRSLVFEPAGMEQTQDGNGRDVIADRAEPYFLGPHGLEHAAPKDLSFLVGAGSVLSTPRDLHRLQRAILGGKLGPSVKQSFTASGPLRWYGSTNGFVSFADFDASTHVHVIFTANLSSGVLNEIRRELPRLIAGETVAPLTIPKLEAADVDVEEYAPAAGDYRASSGTEFTLRIHGGRVFAGEAPLVPRGAHELFAPTDYGVVKLEHGTDGDPDRITWESPSGVTNFERVAER